MLVSNWSESSKRRYTRSDDETIIAMKSEGKKKKEISTVLKRSVASLDYRVKNVLNKEDITCLDDIKYEEEQQLEQVA